METLIKLNSQTAGRDKIARLVQYLCRLLWHRLQQNHSNGVNKLKALEYQLSTFRKLLRLGRCLDTLYSTLSLFSYPDAAVRITVILGKISNALFLLADHILWLGRSDMCSVDTLRWTRISNKYWLYSITMNLIRDMYEITQLLRINKCHIMPKQGLKSASDIISTSQKAFVVLQQNKAIMIDTIKNVCDFCIPLTALGHTDFSPGTIGFLGFVSSLAGLIVLIEPIAKLTPA